MIEPIINHFVILILVNSKSLDPQLILVLLVLLVTIALPRIASPRLAHS